MSVLLCNLYYPNLRCSVVVTIFLVSFPPILSILTLSLLVLVPLTHSLTHPPHPHPTLDLFPPNPDRLARFQSQWCMYVIEIVFLMFKEQVGGVAMATGKCIPSLCSRTSSFSQSPGNLAMAGRTRSQEQKRKEEK